MLFLRKRKHRLPTIRSVLDGNGLDGSPEFEKREYELFARLWFPNGTAKTTYANRLNDVNDWILNFLPGTGAAQLMDVAVSTGITTLDWMNSLERAGRSYHMVAGDAYLRAVRLSFLWFFGCLADSEFRPLYFDWFGWGFPAALRTHEIKRHELAILNGCCRLLLRLQPRLVREIKQGTLVYRGKLVQARACMLASARFLARVGNTLELAEDDLMHPAAPSRWNRRFDVVRAANLLNKSYFQNKELVAMMGELGSRLKVGGVLVVCRTWREDGLNRATAFRRAGNRLKIEGQIREGSDVDGLVDQVILLP